MSARRTALVGRERELRELAQARMDRRAGAVVVGEAGVGKTRLARAFTSDARAAGDTVLAIAATESAMVPFGAFAPLLPVALHDPDPFVMLRQAIEWFPRAAERTRPPVLLVDDAQWLDPPSAMLLHQLVRARQVFLVATSRDEEPLSGALAGIGKDTDAIRIELDALDRPHTAELAERFLGGPLDHPTVQWLWEASGGNPLYLRELIAGARGDGSLIVDRGIWHLIGEPRLAPSLKDLLAARTSRLAPEARWALSLLAVGGPIPLAELSRYTTDDVLLDLEERELVFADTGTHQELVQIAHPLFATAIRSELPPLRSRHVAHALAEMLAQRGTLGAGDALRLARWMIEAGESPSHDLLVRAANEANAASAAKEAEELAHRATAADPTIDALLALARSQISLRRYDSATGTLALAEPLLETPDQGLVYLELQSDLLYWGLREPARARELLARAVGWWKGDRWMSDLETLQLRLLAFDPDQAKPMAEPAASSQAASEDLARIRVANLLRLGRVLEAHAQSELHKGLDEPPTTATIMPARPAHGPLSTAGSDGRTTSVR